MQVDHFESRSQKSIFFDPRNCTLVCSYANWAKGRGIRNMGYWIGRVVEKREGFPAIQDLVNRAKIQVKFTVESLGEIKTYLDGLWRAAGA